MSPHADNEDQLVEPPSIADVKNLPEVTRIHKILLGGGVTIDDPSVVAKSWPGFWSALDLLAGQVCRQNGGQ